MKKAFILLFLGLLLSNNSYAETYFFKNCKLSNAVTWNYIINLEKNVIEVELKRKDCVIQNFSDKIKSIKTKKIISDKIKSTKSENLYFQYFLNSETNSVTKLEYIKQSGLDIDVFKLSSKRITRCLDVKSDWNKQKIEKENYLKNKKFVLITVWPKNILEKLYIEHSAHETILVIKSLTHTKRDLDESCCLQFCRYWFWRIRNDSLPQPLDQ